MDPTTDTSAITLTFEVGEARGLPTNLTTRIEIKGVIGTHLSEPSDGVGSYTFNPSYVEVSKGPTLLDAVCNEKLTVNLLDVTQEAKEKAVCLGSASLSLVPLLQETHHIKQHVVLALNPEVALLANQTEKSPRTVSLDVGISASTLLSFPEDFDDWNIFTVLSWGQNPRPALSLCTLTHANSNRYGDLFAPACICGHGGHFTCVSLLEVLTLLPSSLDLVAAVSLTTGYYEVYGVYNLPSSFSTFGASGPQDIDCHALTYNIHFLGCRLAGGNLVLPPHQIEEKPTSVVNTTKGKKADKLHGGAKNNSSDKKRETYKEADKPAATAPAAGSEGRQPARSSSGSAGAVVGAASCATSSVDEYFGVKQEEAPAGVGKGEEEVGPFLAWEENEVHFYRGRRFLAQLMHTIDRVGGVWLYLVPRLKAPPSDDRGGKSSNKHPKTASSVKSKVGNKPDSQLTVETCRRLAGRAWVPLDALRKDGCLEVSGSFFLQSLEAEREGVEEENGAGSDTPGSRKPEPSTPEPAVSYESFDKAQTHVKLLIRLKNPLLPLQPRDVAPPEHDVSAVAPACLPSTRVPFGTASPVTSSNDNASKTPSDTLSHAPTALAAYVPAHDTGCPSSLAGFKECVQQGIRWIAREVASTFSPAQQHLLAVAMTSNRSFPSTSAARAPGAAAAATGEVADVSSVASCRDVAAETDSPAEPCEDASSFLSTAGAWPVPGTSCDGTGGAVTSKWHAYDDTGIPLSSPPVPREILEAASGSEGLSGAGATAAAEAFIKHLKQCGCYDELFPKVMKAVCAVIRDQLRQDVALTASAAATSAVGEPAVDRSGDEAQQLQKGAQTRQLSTGLLQQRLDRFFSQVFVQLVDTMQSTVNELTIRSQRTLERRRLQAPEPPLWESPEEAETAVSGGGRNASPAANAGSCCRLLHQPRTEEEEVEALARLSFEAEVVGDMQRSIYLHKCRLATPRGQQDPLLWFALARLLLRADETRVEEAEKALWKCINAHGGPDEAAPECLLMLGSCLLHRKRFKQASAAFVRALQCCNSSLCRSAPRDESVKRQEQKEYQERLLQEPTDAAASTLDVEDPQGICADNTANVISSHSSASSAPANTTRVPSEVLPYFFLCMCYFFAGDSRRFEKYLSLALKPAAYFQLECLTQQQQQEELRSTADDEKASEEADERPGSTPLPLSSAWPDNNFEELEQTLSTFPRDTFYSPMEVDYPALSFLLLVLKFGLPSLCFAVLSLEDTLLHPETRGSGLLFLIKAKAYLLKRDFASAAEALHQLLAICPKHREALSLLADCYFRQGLVEPAADYFMRSLDFFETSQDCVIYLRLGQLMLEKKDYETACKYYKQSLQFYTTCEAWLGLAAALYRMRRLPEALEAATAANWLDRSRGETWGYLALIFLLSSSPEKVNAPKRGSSNANARASIGSEARSNDACKIYNNETDTSGHYVGSVNSCQRSTSDVPATGQETRSCKRSPVEDFSCRPSVSKDSTDIRHKSRAPPCAPSGSEAYVSTKYSSEANTCTRYMLKNGVVGRLGIGRLGGLTSVHARLSLNPDNITAEDAFAARFNLPADKESITTLEWGGGLLVEVAHQHLLVRGACAVEVAEAVARKALENPLCGAAAARKVLAEALELQGHYAAAFEELLQVMQLLVEEFEQQQRERLRVLVLAQQHFRGVAQQRKQHQQEQTQQPDVQEQQGTPQGFCPEKLKQQIFKQKALTYAKLAETQKKAWKVAATLNNSAERARLESKERQLLQTLEEMTLENLLPGALTQRELESDL